MRFIAKKGKARMCARPAGYVRQSLKKPVAGAKKKPAQYVRSHELTMSRHCRSKERLVPTMTLLRLSTMYQRHLEPVLRKIGVLDDQRALRYSRCAGCGAVLLKEGGRSRARCKLLAMILFNAVIDVKQCDTHLQLGCNHKAVERIYTTLRSAVASTVRSLQFDM
eukprot:1201519-Amphidinium_carterae.1